MKGICLTFYLVGRLVVYDRYQLRFDEFVCIPLHVRIALRVTMVTMQFHKAKMCLFFKNIVFSFIQFKETIWHQ